MRAVKANPFSGSMYERGARRVRSALLPAADRLLTNVRRAYHRCKRLREVTLGERAARSGFEVTLEVDGGLLGPTLQRHKDRPRTIPRRVDVLSRVMPSKSVADVRSQADVVP